MKIPQLKVIGVFIDSLFALEELFDPILSKAPNRQGVLSKASGAKWKPDVEVLKMRRDAAIASPFSSALALTGSGVPPDLSQRLNTQLVNIAALRAGGLACAARIEGPYYLAGAATARNLDVRHGPEFFDANLWACNFAVQ